MKIFILLLIALLGARVLSAQGVILEGIVTDSLGHPLEMANVLALNVADKTTEAYSITTAKGYYKLVLHKNTVYKIQATYVGAKPLEFDLQTTDRNILREIRLQQGIRLDGIEVVQEMPVRINGDTIVYNSDAFTNGTERKLEDVLKKLPGVEVNEDGSVSVEGKTVTKLMVEGKDFFEGDTKIGTKNIPADAVDKVEVVKNHSEVAQLKGLENNRDETALNIKLKEGKKNFWFGDLTAGGGPDQRYLLNPKLFYYSPKYSLNVIGNSNNVGDIPFSFEDYFKFSGGIRNFTRKGGTNFEILPAELQALFIQNNRAKQITAHFGAANFNFNPSKAWSLSGFAILSRSRVDKQSQSNTSILNNGSSEVLTTQKTLDQTHQASTIGLYKLSSSYEPSQKLRIDYDGLLKTSAIREESNSYTEVWPDAVQSQQINDRSSQHPVSLQQNADAYWKAGKKQTFSWTLQHLYSQKDPFYNALMERVPFAFNDYITGQSQANLQQQRKVTTNKLDATMDYYYSIDKRNQLKFALGYTNSLQNFNSSIFQILDNGMVNAFSSPQYNNAVNYAFSDSYAGLYYKFGIGKLTLNPGLNYHRYTMKNRQGEDLYERTFYRLLPQMDMEYKFSDNESLIYNFSRANNFTDIEQLARGYVLNNYNSLFMGNPTLENSVSQNHSLYYRRFNRFNMSNFFASLNYSKVLEALNTRAFLDGINQVQSPFNSNFANQDLEGSLRYGRSFFKNYKLDASSSLGYSLYYNVQSNAGSGTWNEARIALFNQKYNAAITTVFEKWPSLTLGYSLIINTYPNDRFFTRKPLAKLEYYFWKGFTLVADYQYYRYSNRSKSTNNQYDFLNMSLAYHKKDSSWDYKLAVTNLLNTKSINSDYFYNLSTSTLRYAVQPRYWLLSVTYKL